MMIEPVLSMLTLVCHFKKVMHRVWGHFKCRVGYTLALFNPLVRWHGLQPDETSLDTHIISHLPHPIGSVPHTTPKPIGIVAVEWIVGGAKG
jgi:hypothetical protein